MDEQRPSRRERYRADTREEAKEIALRQLAEGGSGAISLNAIGRAMGLTGPALYRYFTSRDALLNELLVDAYGDLAAATEETARRHAAAEPAARVRALARTFREWALAQPHRYLLLYGTPVPGYEAPATTVSLARRILAPILTALAAFSPGPDTTDPALAALDVQLGAWARETGQASTGDALRRGLIFWTRLHGLLSLEIEGHFSSMGFDPALLYAAEVEALLAGEERPAE